MLKKLKQIFILSTLVIILNLIFQVTYASSNLIEEGFYYVLSALGENSVLDIDGGSTSTGRNVQLWTKNNTIAQVFKVKKCQGNYYEITALCSGKKLDVQGGSKQCGANVHQYYANNTDAQKWQITPADKNNQFFYVTSKVNGLNIDVSEAKLENGTNIQVWNPNNTNAQKWKFQKVNVEQYVIKKTKRDFSKRLNWMESKFFDYYCSKKASNILVLCDLEFQKNFNQIFKNQTNFQFEVCNSIDKIKNLQKYDLIINTKYNQRYIPTILENAKVDDFESTYASILYQTTIDYLKENEIPIYFFNAPLCNKIKNMSNFEKDVCFKSIAPDDRLIVKDKSYLEMVYESNKKCIEYMLSPEYFKSIKIVNVGNHLGLSDFKGKYINNVNGKRFTPNAPSSYSGTIYMYGPCTIRCKYVPDEYTIASFIQKRINKELPNSYKVENCGLEADEINDFEWILDTEFKHGDIIIEERSFSEKLIKIIKENKCMYKELSPIFNRPHNYGNWIVNHTTHVNQNGNQAIANYIYTCIKEDLKKRKNLKNFDKTITFHQKSNNEATDEFIKNNPDFKIYLENLKSISKDKKGKKIGSLNMNCNPFTLGHRYLIEEALKMVDHLYLFVVEEDASEFGFKDRYEMVKRGISDLQNITLLKTGKWMCSKFTFPDYFDKDNLQNKVILNPTKDIDIYGKYIAPALGATIRFAGEEPLDLITRQHNDFMRNKLPQYGIEFCEIPRKLLPNGQVISASNVRKLLKAKNFKEIKSLVPITTYDYLLEHFLNGLKKA